MRVTDEDVAYLIGVIRIGRGPESRARYAEQVRRIVEGIVERELKNARVVAILDDQETRLDPVFRKLE